MPRTGHAVIASLALSIASIASAQLGPVNPPAGPITNTGPDLSQIDGRTPLSAENTPGDADSVFRIIRPGSYYLTGDVTVPSGRRGIEIAADEVSVDLNGYTLRGQAGNLGGINSFSSEETRVANGNIVDMEDSGVDLNREWVVEDVWFDEIDGHGVSASFAGIVRRCFFKNAGGASSSAISVNCCVQVYECRFQGGNGVVGPAIRGFQNVNVRDCGFNNLSGPAIQAETESLISNNTLEFQSVAPPAGSGAIIVGSRSIVRGNIIDTGLRRDTSTNGIYVTGSESRIEGNNIAGGRIESVGSDNLIVKNSVDSPIVATGADIVGPSVTTTSGLSSASAWANIVY